MLVVPNLGSAETELAHRFSCLRDSLATSSPHFMPPSLTSSKMAASLETLSPSFEDRTDFDLASRGFLGALKPGIIKNAKGEVVIDLDKYNCFEKDCPPTANPKLWRYGQLLYRQGLYEVAKDQIYQVRGFDVSNITFVEGREGVIVIDPLVSNETASAALHHYWQLRGHKKPVKAMILSHSHIDHFGGGQGIVDASDDKSFPIIAPAAFIREAISENTVTGPAMRARSAYMRGAYLPRGPEGQIGDGLGLGMSVGTHSCLPPTILIHETGDELAIDGVKMVFQSVDGTEAPAEVNIFFPELEAVFISECLTHTHHNILPLRGTVVRDAKLWSQKLDETMILYGTKSKVLFAGHHWPTWGCDEICKLMIEQRDFYAYLHDQTIRMANKGMTGAEIAEHITIPAQFQTAWHLQGYYGSVSHNVKAIHQKYLGWFDGRPHTLWQYPAAEEGARYVEAFGGIDKLVAAGVRFTEEKQDLRFACTLLAHANYADKSHEGAKKALARCYERLGYGAENATWRNFYLTGAHELLGKERYSRGAQPLSPFNPGVPTDKMLATLAVKIDGPRAAKQSFSALELLMEDGDDAWRLTVSNGAFIYRKELPEQNASQQVNSTLRVKKSELIELLQSKSGSLPDGLSDSERTTFHNFLDVFEV